MLTPARAQAGPTAKPPPRRHELAVILVSYNAEHLLPRCLDALGEALRGIRAQVVIVDNASSGGAPNRLLQDYPEAVLIENASNIGFGRANNQALAYCDASYVLLLNTDAFVSPTAIRDSLEFMRHHPSCGILGARLTGQDGALQPSARFFPSVLNLFMDRAGLRVPLPGVRPVDPPGLDMERIQECDWVPGCYYLVRSEVIEQVGLFDERYFLYSEEVDHCFAAKRAGWKVVYFPHATVVHLGGESAGSAGQLSATGRQIEVLQIESELLYFRKNHGLAAVWAHVALTTLADALIVLKRLIRSRRPLLAQVYWQHCRAYWRLLRATRLATLPTR